MSYVPLFGFEDAPDVTQETDDDETNVDLFDDIPEYGDDEYTDIGAPTGEDI